MSRTPLGEGVHTLTLRVTKRQHAKWRAMAKESEMSMSQWVRYTLDNGSALETVVKKEDE